MTNTPPRRPPPLRDVLYALAQPAPDAALVDAFVRHDPESAADLTESAVALALDAIAAQHEPVEMPVATPPPGVSRAMRRFHHRLYAVRKGAAAEAAKAAPAVENPFATLTRAEIRALARRLHANTVFVMKLRDRLIRGDTTPAGFLRRLADALGARLETVVAHVAAPAYVPSRAHFKADTKPEAGGKQTFEEAVRSCGLSPTRRAARGRWRRSVRALAWPPRRIWSLRRWRHALTLETSSWPTARAIAACSARASACRGAR